MRKLLITALLTMCVLAGCGKKEDSTGGENQSSSSIQDNTKDISENAKTSTNLYETEELTTMRLGDIEFKIPEKFNDDTRENEEYAYYYYDDLICTTGYSKEDEMTNEALIEGKDSYVDGILESVESGKLISSNIIDTKIGKAVKSVTEQTVNDKRCIFNMVSFVHNSNLYMLGFTEEKDSKWDYSKDFECLIESITRAGIADFTWEETEKFLSDFQSLKDWFAEYSEEIVYSKYNKKKNKDTYKTSTGVITDISSSIEWIDFIQEIGTSYFTETADVEDVFFKNANTLDDFKIGDGIKLYYYIDDNNKVLLLAMEKIKPSFKMKDYINTYKKNCEEYTYEKIARNPGKVKGEFVKLTGEVIQVMENDGSVELRVNITKNSYGYYSDTVYVYYPMKSKDGDRILEDDIITIYGKLAGTETYTSVLGSEVTLPKINAEYIEFNKK